MQLSFLIALTMCAFAMNSVLTRIAINGELADPISFATLRVFFGATVLCGLILSRRSKFPAFQWLTGWGSMSLAVYMTGFSYAYIILDAGLGALVLFGVVQISMFGFSAIFNRAPTAREGVGSTIAFLGLIVVLWPTGSAKIAPFGAISMVFAGVGWAAYTLIGRQSKTPLETTALQFLMCLPILLACTAGFALFGWIELRWTFIGLILAALCGGLTSGLGYALWYHVLPNIRANDAAILQLSVPIIAIFLGVVALGEALSWLLALSAALVVGGIAWALTGPKPL